LTSGEGQRALSNGGGREQKRSAHILGFKVWIEGENALDRLPFCDKGDTATTVVAALLAGQQGSTGAVPSLRTQVDLV